MEFPQPLCPLRHAREPQGVGDQRVGRPCRSDGGKARGRKLPAIKTNATARKVQSDKTLGVGLEGFGRIEDA